MMPLMINPAHSLPELTKVFLRRLAAAMDDPAQARPIPPNGGLTAADWVEYRETAMRT